MGFPACLFTKGKGDYSGDESAVLPMEGFHSGDIRLPRSSWRFWEDLAKEVRAPTLHVCESYFGDDN